MAKNTFQSPDYNPNANGYSDGYGGQGRLVNQQAIVDPKANMIRPTTGGFKPSVMPTDGGGGASITKYEDRWMSPDYNPYGGDINYMQPPPQTGEGLPPEVGMADPTPPIVGGGTGFDDMPSMPPLDIPMSGGEAEAQTPVSAQPDYSSQTQYEAFTPPDPAADIQSAADTAAQYGGGQAVDTNVAGAESYLGDNRDLNAISTGENARSAAESAIYDSMASRLDPQYAQQANDLEISLRNRGLSEGDAAFDSAMANFNRAKTDAYQQANWQAIQGGGQEAQRNQQMDLDRRAQMFGEALGMSQQEIDKNRNALQAQAAQNQFSLGMAGINQQQGQYDRMYDLQSQAQGFGQQMQGANYQNQLRQQQIQEEMLRRNQSLNELNALLTGSQVSQPNFTGYNQAGNAGGVDYSGAAQNQYGASLDAANIGNAAISNAFSGMSSMAGMFSDERLKDNIVKVGEYKGINLYTWTWNNLMPEVFKRGQQGFGVLAQEIEKLMPSAVIEHASGFKKVIYREVFNV